MNRARSCWSLCNFISLIFYMNRSGTMLFWSCLYILLFICLPLMFSEGPPVLLWDRTRASRGAWKWFDWAQVLHRLCRGAPHRPQEGHQRLPSSRCRARFLRPGPLLPLRWDADRHEGLGDEDPQRAGGNAGQGGEWTSLSAIGTIVTSGQHSQRHHHPGAIVREHKGGVNPQVEQPLHAAQPLPGPSGRGGRLAQPVDGRGTGLRARRGRPQPNLQLLLLRGNRTLWSNVFNSSLNCRRAWMSHSPLWSAKSCLGLLRAPCDAPQRLALGQRSPCRYFHKYFPSISSGSYECLCSIKFISQANCCSPSMNKSVP